MCVFSILLYCCPSPRPSFHLFSVAPKSTLCDIGDYVLYDFAFIVGSSLSQPIRNSTITPCVRVVFVCAVRPRFKLRSRFSCFRSIRFPNFFFFFPFRYFTNGFSYMVGLGLALLRFTPIAFYTTQTGRGSGHGTATAATANTKNQCEKKRITRVDWIIRSLFFFFFLCPSAHFPEPGSASGEDMKIYSYN